MPTKKAINDNNDQLTVSKKGKKKVEKKKRELTEYNYFVRSELKVVKAAEPEIHHRDAIKKVGENWQKKKLTTTNNN